MKDYLRLEDKTIWANPNDPNEVIDKLLYSQEPLTKTEKHYLASVFTAYNFLIFHPAMTLKEVSKKISMIRKAYNKIKSQEGV